jgi:hypothetical protein
MLRNNLIKFNILIVIVILIVIPIGSSNLSNSTIQNSQPDSIQLSSQPPAIFSLSTNASAPDTNGFFDLIWIKSNETDYYTIYYSSSFITEINEQVQILCDKFTPAFDWPTYRYKINNWADGTYYFLVVAFNTFGTINSNCIQVVVERTKTSEQSDPRPILQELNIELVLIIGFISALGALVFVKKYRDNKKYGWMRSWRK